MFNCTPFLDAAIPSSKDLVCSALVSPRLSPSRQKYVRPWPIVPSYRWLKAPFSALSNGFRFSFFLWVVNLKSRTIVHHPTVFQSAVVHLHPLQYPARGKWGLGTAKGRPDLVLLALHFIHQASSRLCLFKALILPGSQNDPVQEVFSIHAAVFG